MADSPEYKAFSSYEATLIDSIADHPHCIGPLAQRLKEKEGVLNPFTFKAIINDSMSAYEKASKIVNSASAGIKRNSSLFYFFVDKVREVKLTHDAETLKDKLSGSKHQKDDSGDIKGGDTGWQDAETLKDKLSVLKRRRDDSGDTKGGGTGWQGVAVLITNTYENTPSMKSLPGVVKDREELNKTFCDPFFNVIEAQDATSKEMMYVIDCGSKDVKKEEYKCVFIVFSGHGCKNSRGNECIICNDGNEIEVSGFVEDIIEKFGREIPKVILIDACRGEKKLEDTKDPNDNCLVAFATQEDYKAMAPKSGSYWIPVVAKCLREMDDTVVNVIEEANRIVRTNSDLKKHQNPVITENSLTDQVLCVYQSLDKGCQPQGKKSKLKSQEIPRSNSEKRSKEDTATCSLSGKEFEKLRRCVKSVHTSYYDKIRNSVKDNMDSFTSKLFEKELISEEVKRSQDYAKVTNEFWASLEWKETLKEVESHCLKFLACLSALGGGSKEAAGKLQEEWQKKIEGELKVPFLAENSTTVD